MLMMIVMKMLQPGFEPGISDSKGVASPDIGLQIPAGASYFHIILILVLVPSHEKGLERPLCLCYSYLSCFCFSLSCEYLVSIDVFEHWLLPADVYKTPSRDSFASCESHQDQ